MTKHTPGPWTVHLGGDSEHYIKGDGWVIATTHAPHASQLSSEKANAQLIAASPDMFRALDIISTPLKNAGQDLTREQLINLLFDYRLEACKAISRTTGGKNE